MTNTVDDIPKAPYGSPCNNCGLCCRRSLCPIAEILFPEATAPCPAIDLQPDGRSLCGVVTDAPRHAPAHSAKHGAEAVAASSLLLNGDKLGCDSQEEHEYDNPAFVFMMALYDLEHRKKIRDARKIWGL